MTMLLDFHEITLSPNNTAIYDGRTLRFQIEESEITVVEISSGNTIVIKNSELKWLNNPVFPYIRLVKQSDGIDPLENLTEISATDASIRLSLCFKGDVVKITRPVLFTGAGTQRETMVMRVE
jgi:hypothetical protein